LRAEDEQKQGEDDADNQDEKKQNDVPTSLKNIESDVNEEGEKILKPKEDILEK